jgi:hypothetical protein
MAMVRDEKKVQRAWSLSELKPIARIEPGNVPDEMTQVELLSTRKGKGEGTYDERSQRMN